MELANAYRRNLPSRLFQVHAVQQ